MSHSSLFLIPHSRSIFTSIEENAGRRELNCTTHFQVGHFLELNHNLTYSFPSVSRLHIRKFFIVNTSHENGKHELFVDTSLYMYGKGCLPWKIVFSIKKSPPLCIGEGCIAENVLSWLAILICMLHVPPPRCSKVTPRSPVPRAPSADENTPRRPTPGQWSLRRGHLYFLLWRPLTKQGSQHEQGSECREGELQRSSEYKITGHQYADETLQPREEKHGRICIWICLYVHVCRGSLKESVREKRRERERERERDP